MSNDHVRDIDIPQDDENGMRSPKNNMGHVTVAHRHLLSLDPEGISEENWSRLSLAYQLVREVRESEEFGRDPVLPEAWNDRAPRRYACDCGAVFRSPHPPRGTGTRGTGRGEWRSDTPRHCPFCVWGDLRLVEGRPHDDDTDDTNTNTDMDMETTND